jgi:hypothetical protein
LCIGWAEEGEELVEGKEEEEEEVVDVAGEVDVLTERMWAVDVRIADITDT